MLPEAAVVCQWSWSSQGHTCRLSSVSLLNHVFYCCSFTQDPLFSFWKHSCYLSYICTCAGAVSYLPCASKELLRTSLRMAHETSVCARGVGEMQEVYLSSPPQQCAVNCSSLLPPAGSCPRALHSLLMLEPCPGVSTYCREQRCPVAEGRSYKHLVTMMVKWDIGVLCPVLVPAVGFPH